MIAILFLGLVIFLLLGVGVFIIIGTLKGWDPLIHPPDSWFLQYPYGPLRRYFGEGIIPYFHIFIGIVFILGTLWLVIYVKFYL